MTPNKEDYLKCIYEISTQQAKVTNKEIASRMQVSPPAVTEMMKRLVEDGYINKQAVAGWLLTAEGLSLVSDLYRKHRLLEVFLMEKLGYTTDQIHEEAEVLEHTISDLFVERLDKLLGQPKTCPHGGTIPDKGALLEEQHQLTLANSKEEGTYVLTRVQDNYDLLHYLEKHDLNLGDEIALDQYDPYTQLYSLNNGADTFQISQTIAEQIYVEKKD